MKVEVHFTALESLAWSLAYGSGPHRELARAKLSAQIRTTTEDALARARRRAEDKVTRQLYFALDQEAFDEH